ncbi:MAG TPA: glycoside hydrolase family 30 beta sandwich domain-containing protein, partial [Bacteroidales bacterium]|nr:glycoside hydrolase family 30 beta sandwich domain-containing protein [Bacteroidales bacterium]HPU83550.1 glycoside hydrolase family 30 beta sandwich domain-containing protein [Bacteroidales bacterium]
FQPVDGFGFTLTGGSAKLLWAMKADARAEILEKLFGVGENNIGTSYLRLSLGSSDLDEYTFSYNQTPGDVDMEHFDLGYDRKYLIPVLKLILGINPDIRLMASPWSAPAWMKTNNATVGGRLKEECYKAYALYFVKYIQQMKAEGIVIDAVTVQNEPLHGGNNPSMEMSPAEQADFIKNHLGPAFAANNIKTKIVIYDHNCDRSDYPLAVLADPEAYGFIDGTAFHLYGGDISALSTVHDAHPDKSLYFTEQWIGAPANFAGDVKWHIREVIIGSMRNWSRIALEWNLASDPTCSIHTSGGCTNCLGAITIDGNKVTFNPAYYIIAHAAKYVRPGSVRVESGYSGNPDDLPNVAFLTPDNRVVILVLNNMDKKQTFNVKCGGTAFTTELAAGEVATYVL